MIEKYWFPWGNKRELQHRSEWLRAERDSSRLAHRMTEQSFQNLLRIYNDKEDELHQIHLRKLIPIVEDVRAISNIDAHIDHIYNVDAVSISTRIDIPRYRFTADNAMDYTERSIQEASRELAHRLASYVAGKMRDVFFKMRGEYKDQNDTYRGL